MSQNWKIVKCFLFFVRPSAINNKPPKKKKQLDIKLDNSTSSFIPKIYGKNKREKECSDWKTIHNYFISFSWGIFQIINSRMFGVCIE